MLSGVLLSVSNSPRITHIGVMNRYFFGPEGLVASVNDGDTKIAQFVGGLVRNTTIGSLLVILVVIIVAVILQKFASIWLTKINKTQLWLWAAGGLVLVVYAFFAIKYMMPFALLVAQTGVYTIYHTSGWLYLLLGYFMMALSLHWFVPFLRMASWHARLFDHDKASLLKAVVNTKNTSL